MHGYFLKLYDFYFKIKWRKSEEHWRVLEVFIKNILLLDLFLLLKKIILLH